LSRHRNGKHSGSLYSLAVVIEQCWERHIISPDLPSGTVIVKHSVIQFARLYQFTNTIPRPYTKMLDQMNSSMFAPSARNTLELSREQPSLCMSVLTGETLADSAALLPSIDHNVVSLYYAARKLPAIPPKSPKRLSNQGKKSIKKRTSAASTSRRVPSPSNIEKIKKPFVNGHQRKRHAPVCESELPMEELRKIYVTLSPPQVPHEEPRKSFETLRESHVSAALQRKPFTLSLYPASSRSIYSRPTNSIHDSEPAMPQLITHLSPATYNDRLDSETISDSSCDHDHFNLDRDVRRVDIHTASLKSSPPQPGRFQVLLGRIRRVLPFDQPVGRRRSRATSVTPVGKEHVVRLRSSELAPDGSRRRKGKAVRSWIGRRRDSVSFW
jgi:hypothetical protein